MSWMNLNLNSQPSQLTHSQYIHDHSQTNFQMTIMHQREFLRRQYASWRREELCGRSSEAILAVEEGIKRVDYCRLWQDIIKSFQLIFMSESSVSAGSCLPPNSALFVHSPRRLFRIFCWLSSSRKFGVRRRKSEKLETCSVNYEPFTNRTPWVQPRDSLWLVSWSIEAKPIIWKVGPIRGLWLFEQKSREWELSETRQLAITDFLSSQLVSASPKTGYKLSWLKTHKTMTTETR